MPNPFSLLRGNGVVVPSSQLSWCDHTFVGEQGVREGTKQATLRGFCVEDQRGRCVGAYPYHLGAARQEVQDPVAERGV
jgi:hypothetical protein